MNEYTILYTTSTDHSIQHFYCYAIDLESAISLFLQYADYVCMTLRSYKPIA